MQLIIIKALDMLLAFIGLLILSPVILITYVIGYIDTGSPLFIQTRIGKNQKPFKLIKFRSMKIGTLSVGTHLANNSSITRFGKILRKTKLDELPQLLNVLKGEMSLVGPRPGLPTQEVLLKERLRRNVFSVRPGITGLAQIHNIDMSTPRKLSRYDKLMLNNINLCLYGKMIILTILGSGAGDKINPE